MKFLIQKNKASLTIEDGKIKKFKPGRLPFSCVDQKGEESFAIVDAVEIVDDMVKMSMTLTKAGKKTIERWQRKQKRRIKNEI